jgi:hypothetical protein
VTRPDGAIQPIAVKITGQLQHRRLPTDAVRAAHIGLLAMQSSRLGYPISVLLDPQDMQTVVQMLDATMEMAPDGSVREFRNLKPEQLFVNGGAQLAGKCLVSLVPNGFAKVSQDIDFVLSRGFSVRQDVVKGKFDVGIKQHRIDLPLSIVGIDQGNVGNKLAHPSILKVPLTAYRGLGSGATSTPILNDAELLQCPVFKIKKSLERLRPRGVIIPYEDQLADAIKASGCDHPDIKLKVLKNVISLLTIINQPPPVTRSEVGAIIYRTDEAEVRHWLSQVGVEESQSMSTDDAPLTATKIEYYMAMLLLDGLLLTGGLYLTERQQKVFDMVAAINMSKVSAAIIKKGDDIEKMSTIARSSGYWARRELVFEEINKSSAEFYSLSTISNELMELLKMGLLERAKPKKQNFYGYFVTTVSPNGVVSLPAPSQIEDTVYKDKSITIVNPITGQVEKV